MNFCENCNVAFESERCPACGTKNVRPACDDDFCFLFEDSVLHSNVLMSVLDANDIPYSAMPFGSGVESCAAKSLNNYRIYVPFGSLNSAKNILRDMEARQTEELRAQLLDNVKSFNVPSKLEKKTRKKLKLPKETDFIAYCIDIVKNADRITDTASFAQWRYIYCYSGDICISFNSMSYEILAVRSRKA